MSWIRQTNLRQFESKFNVKIQEKLKPKFIFRMKWKHFNSHPPWFPQVSHGNQPARLSRSSTGSFYRETDRKTETIKVNEPSVSKRYNCLYQCITFIEIQFVKQTNFTQLAEEEILCKEMVSLWQFLDKSPEEYLWKLFMHGNPLH